MSAGDYESALRAVFVRPQECRDVDRALFDARSYSQRLGLSWRAYCLVLDCELSRYFR